MILQVGQTIRYLGHIWIIQDKSSLGPRFVRLKRKHFLSDLKRYGQVATEIDAHFEDIKRLAKV